MIVRIQLSYAAIPMMSYNERVIATFPPEIGVKKCRRETHLAMTEMYIYTHSVFPIPQVCLWLQYVVRRLVASIIKVMHLSVCTGPTIPLPG